MLEATRSDLPVLGWAVGVGVLAGGVGSAFRSGTSAIASGLAELSALGGDGTIASLVLSVLSCSVLVGVAFYAVSRFAPEAAGSGVQEIEGALDGVRPLRWARVLCVKFGAGLLSLGAGMALGREGPIVQMGGALGQMLRERFSLSEEHGRILIAAGAGAGLTAAFNTPLAGMLFVVEEMRPHFRFSVISVQCVLIACVMADIVVRALLGGAPSLAVGDFPMPPLSGLPSLVLLGAALGAVGLAFNASILGMQGVAGRLSPGVRFAVALGVGALVGAVAHFAPDFGGGGYAAIADALSGSLAERQFLLLFAVRFALTVVCFSTGVPGGIFAPMVALGAIFGLGFANVVPHDLPGAAVAPGVFMIAGTGALFAATVRAPITGIVLAAELTGNFALILPVAATCISATLVAHALGGSPIYTVLLERELVLLKR